MNFASYSDEATAPIKGSCAGSSDAISWGPNNVIAIATQHNVQFRQYAHAAHVPSTPMMCDVIEDVKPCREMIIDRVNFSPFLLSGQKRREVMGEDSKSGVVMSSSTTTGGSSSSSLGAALCAYKTISSVIEILVVDRTVPSLNRMASVALGPCKLSILPQMRPTVPLPQSKQSSKAAEKAAKAADDNDNDDDKKAIGDSNKSLQHAPAFSYHLTAFEWISAGELLLITNMGIMCIDVVKEIGKEAANARAAVAEAIAKRKQKSSKGKEQGPSLILNGIQAGAAGKVNATPTVVMEVPHSSRIAAWPPGFAPMSSALVHRPNPPPPPSAEGESGGSRSNVSTSHPLLLVAGMLSIAGREQAILLGYDITATSIGNATQHQREQGTTTAVKGEGGGVKSKLKEENGASSSVKSAFVPKYVCQAAFAVNIASKALAIIPHFEKVVESAAMATMDCFAPSAMAARLVASSVAGVSTKPSPTVATNASSSAAAAAPPPAAAAITAPLPPPPHMLGVGRELHVVEVMLAGPIGSMLVHLSLSVGAKGYRAPLTNNNNSRSSDGDGGGVSPIVTLLHTTITGAAIVARWGSTFSENVLASASSSTGSGGTATPPLPAMQTLVSCDTITSGHAQDPSVCRVIPLHAASPFISGINAVTGSVGGGTNAPTPDGATASPITMTIATSAVICSHYILIGSDCVTMVSILRDNHQTIAVHSDAIVDSVKTAISHFESTDVGEVAPPLIGSCGLAMHPSGAMGIALCAIRRQRKDEIRMVPFSTAYSPVFVHAMQKYTELRHLLTVVSGTPQHSMGTSRINKAVNLPTVLERYHGSQEFAAVLTKVGDACQQVYEFIVNAMAAGRDEAANPAGTLLLPTDPSRTTVGGGFVRNHHGMIQFGQELNRIIMRATLTMLIAGIRCELCDLTSLYPASTIAANAAQHPANDIIGAQRYADGCWDCVLIDTASIIPTNETVPPQLAAAETIAARLIIFLAEMTFAQLCVGQMIVSAASSSAIAGGAGPKWLGGRNQYGVDMYGRHPMSLAPSRPSPPPPYWQRSIIEGRCMIRWVELHRTQGATASQWLQLYRKRLTSEVLLARAASVLHAFIGGAPMTATVVDSPAVGNKGTPRASAAAAAKKKVKSEPVATPPTQAHPPPNPTAPIPPQQQAPITIAAVAIAEAVLRGYIQFASLDLAGMLTATIKGCVGLLEKVAAYQKRAGAEDTEAAIKAMCAAVVEPAFLATAAAPTAASASEAVGTKEEAGGDEGENKKSSTKAGSKRRRDESSATVAESFIMPPLTVSIKLPSSGNTTVASVDLLELNVIPWGSASVGRCSAGCGQLSLLKEEDVGKSLTACPLCHGQLTPE